MVARVVGAGGEAFVSRGLTRTIIGLVGDIEKFQQLNPDSTARRRRRPRLRPVQAGQPAEPPGSTTVWVGDVPIGPDTFTLIAGPCAVESLDQTYEAAQDGAGGRSDAATWWRVQAADVALRVSRSRRGSAAVLAEVRDSIGMPVVTEVVDAHDVELVAKYVDMLQIGTRNMQNFALLQAVARSTSRSCSSAA